MFSFCSTWFGHSSSLPAPALAPVLESVPYRDWNAVEGGGSLTPEVRGRPLGHFSCCIHAGLLPQPCPPFAHAPCAQVAQWCAGGRWLRGPSRGVQATGPRFQSGRECGCSPDPQHSLPINKRFPSSFQPCTAIACSPPGPLCPHVVMEMAIQRPGTSRLSSSPGGPGWG